MGPMTAEELKNRIAKVIATDLLSGETQELVCLPNSRCHFFKRFRSGEHDVQLRIDWGKFENGFPHLDLDLYDPLTGIMDKTIERKVMKFIHQTAAKPMQNVQLYIWEYQDQKRHLRIDLSWFVTGTGHQWNYATGEVCAVNPPD